MKRSEKLRRSKRNKKEKSAEKREEQLKLVIYSLQIVNTMLTSVNLLLTIIIVR